jgi:hypothetical protein
MVAAGPLVVVVVFRVVFFVVRDDGVILVWKRKRSIIL